ncbi:MAG: MerR family transcriptional regulator [Ignavibacterium sp.]|nr:MerR family transcriptional regulator [Ignavibacterium sp.]MDW8375012.1 MerR family transcriptional regulator [Ignavibacteriales bacterium]
MKDLSIKKLYYSISEVSKLTNVEQYILRYWETEFEQLKPQKNRAGNRIYTNKDIDLILKIKTLLRDKKYTVEGAKKILSSGDFDSQIHLKESSNSDKEVEKNNEVRKNNFSEELRRDLSEIKKILEELYNKL